MAQTAELLNLPHQPTDKAVSIDIHDNTLSSQTPILPIKDISYHTITTQQDFTKLLDKLNHTPYFAIDTETTDINWQHAKLVGISVSTADYEGYYIPVGHTADFDVLLDNQLPIDTVLSAFKPILENPNIGKIGQHLKYDAHIFKSMASTYLLGKWIPCLLAMSSMLLQLVMVWMHWLSIIWAYRPQLLKMLQAKVPNSLVLIRSPWMQQASMHAKRCRYYLSAI